MRLLPCAIAITIALSFVAGVAEEVPNRARTPEELAAAVREWSARGRDAGLTVTEEAAHDRERVLEWSKSLRTFKGAYTLTQFTYRVAGHDSETPGLFPMDFRLRGGDRYWHWSHPIPDGGYLHSYLACLNGQFMSRKDAQYGEAAPEVLVFLGKNEGWPQPEGAYITPEMLFNGGCGQLLSDYMSQGTTRMLEKAGRRVLSHHRQPADRTRLDIWLDESGLPETFEFGLATKGSDDELRELGCNEPSSLFRIDMSIDVGNFEEAGGISFPTWARKVWWGYDDDAEVARRREDWTSGKLSPLELEIRQVTECGPGYEACIQYFEVRPSDILVNKALADSDFEIEIPIGAAVQKELGGKYEIYRGTPDEKLGKLLPLLLMLLVLACFVALASWFLKRRQLRKRRS